MVYVLAAAEEEAHLVGLRAQSNATYKGLLAERDEQIVAARNSIGPGSDRWKRSVVSLRNAEEKPRDVYARLQRLTDARRISLYWVVLIAIGLAALEAPINKFMLDNILRGNNFDSYAISLFMTFICLGLAHIGGILARQIRGTYHETIYLGNIVGVIWIFAILAIWIGALTIGRAFYSVAGPGSLGAGIFVEISRQVATIGPWTAFSRALSDQSAFFLACLNVAGIAFVFLVAFITNDSDKVYQSALDGAENANRKHVRLERKYDRVVKKIAKKFGLKLGITAATYGAQNAQILTLKRSRNAELDKDDLTDLSTLDTILTAAREEIAQNSRAFLAGKSHTVRSNGRDKDYFEGAPKLGDNLADPPFAERERT